MDSDSIWDLYEEQIQGWDLDKIIKESELVRKDFNEGRLDPHGYARAIEILENELYQQTFGSKKPPTPAELYDRAMKGI